MMPKTVLYPKSSLSTPDSFFGQTSKEASFARIVNCDLAMNNLTTLDPPKDIWSNLNRRCIEKFGKLNYIKNDISMDDILWARTTLSAYLSWSAMSDYYNDIDKWINNIYDYESTVKLTSMAMTTTSTSTSTVTATTESASAVTTMESASMEAAVITTESTSMKVAATTTESTSMKVAATTTESTSMKVAATTTELTSMETAATTTESTSMETAATTTESTSMETAATTTESTSMESTSIAAAAAIKSSNKQKKCEDTLKKVKNEIILKFPQMMMLMMIMMNMVNYFQYNILFEKFQLIII